MKCLSCQYPLWGIAARICPECGTHFAPSGFRFPPWAVKFCCPHCDLAYYGTDADGLLKPREFECVGCSKPITLDKMIVRPRREGFSVKMPLNVNPWEDRRHLGRRRAALQTMFLGVGNMGELMRVTRPEQSTGLRFLMFLWSVTVIVGAIPFMLMFLVPFVATGPRSGVSMLSTPFFGVVVALVTSLLGMLVGVLLAAGVAHGVLRVFGPLPHGYNRTLQAFTYTCGPMALCAFPCLGFYWTPIGLVWWSILAGSALVSAQRVGAWRATAAIVTGPLLIAVVLYIVAYVNS
ncbi:MAG: hypothetical protein GC200_12060 [Tepidisphaera sp.]|nr:hypothetical protein [Tepidisphaera sp.]